MSEEQSQLQDYGTNGIDFSPLTPREREVVEAVGRRRDGVRDDQRREEECEDRGSTGRAGRVPRGLPLRVKTVGRLTSPRIVQVV